MEVSEFFSSWTALTAEQRRTLQAAARLRGVSAGEMVHGGASECTGLLLVCSGRLRAYSASADGREITLYRLLERDVCLFSASCAFRAAEINIAVRAEEDSSFWVIPAEVYQRTAEACAPLSAEMSRLMAGRFSEIMWLLEQVLWKSMDKRLAAFLAEEANLEGTDRLRITHEELAAHLGTAREVVTRMLHYLQNEGLVRLTRGSIELTDRAGLEKLGNL